MGGMSSTHILQFDRVLAILAIKWAASFPNWAAFSLNFEMPPLLGGQSEKAISVFLHVK